MPLEEMNSFFDARVKDYEEYVRQEADGAQDYYRETAKLIPKRKRLSLVDLGVGTGLELDEIFQQNPGVTVPGIDISEGMLRKLREKNRKRMEQVQAVKGNFFEYDFGIERYDGAVSVMSMHYFEPQAKLELYRKLGRSLKKGGFYLETDLYAPNGEYEQSCAAENERLRREQGIRGGFYHYRIPCTVERQAKLFFAAGFSSVRVCWACGNTVILMAKK